MDLLMMELLMKSAIQIDTNPFSIDPD